MNKIKTLEELRKCSSEEDVKHIFTEYVMELIGKAEKMDEMVDLLEHHGTLKDIKKIGNIF